MERKLVTVLFVDAVGSTSIADRVDPERLRSVQDAYFEAMSAAVLNWGGAVEKFIGDAVMAVFGVPAVREDDASRALSAAFEMAERLDRLNSDLQQRHGITLRMRIGVNTGEVVAAASTGDGQRLVSGEPVNVAARLQAEAEPGSILAGDRTYQAARHAFEFSEPLELRLKGKLEPVTARRVLGPRSESTRGVPGLASPLVGRTAELQNLSSVLDELLEAGQPRLVTVLGPAGVGKSRLVREFLADLRQRYPEARVLRGRCLAAGQGITYWALGEILRAACGIQLDDSAAAALEKLHSTATDERMSQALALTAGIPVPNTRLSQMTPQGVADELAWAWPRFASAQAETLAVWVIEDLHWAGAPLLEMLERVIARSTGPLLVVGTARADLVEAHPGFGGGSENFSTISLRPLSRRHSEELLRAILAVADFPSDLADEILSRAEGNPFFLEEIVRRLMDEGTLKQEEGHWKAAPGRQSTPLPDSLLAVLSARIDSLSELEKRVLQEAAVIGKVFWAEPLGRAVSGDVPSVLLSLEKRGLVSARTTSSIANHSEYTFKHVLVRDVAYGSLSKARRARAHAEVGAWIEALAGDRTEEFGELIAYHYASAAIGPDADLAWSEDEREPVRRKAFESLLAAGAQARRRFAIAKSVELHRQALTLAADDREKLRILEEIGDDHVSAYHGDDARAVYTQALDITSRVGAPEVHAAICAKLAEMMSSSPGAFRTSPDPDDVEQIIADGLARATDPETIASLQLSSGNLARLYSGSEPFGQGHKPDLVPLDDRIAAVEKALDVADSHDNSHLQLIGSYALGILYGIAGRYRDELDLAVKVLPLVERMGSRNDQGDAIRRAAVVTMNVTGDYVEGLRLARDSLELSRDTSPHQLMHGTCPVITALYELGRWEEIPPVLQEHLEAFRMDPAIECDFVRDGPILGALVAARSGQPGRARELGAMLPDPASELERATAWQSMLAVALGQPDLARQISEGTALKGRSFGPHHARAMLEALVALKDWSELERFVVLARPHTAGLAVLGPCCDRAEGLVRKQRGDQSAVDLLERAEARFKALKAGAELAATRKLTHHES